MTDQSGPGGLERLIVYLCCSAGSVAIAIGLGKDVQWDQINYHLYAGYTAFHTRLDRDFMAASIQGYHNRLSFVPFSLLALSGLKSIYVAAVLAVMQSAALWSCYEIALALPRPAGRSGRVVAIGTVILASLYPIFWTQAGSSANDVLTAVPILAAWALMVHAVRNAGRSWLLIAAGLLLGIGAGLKLTNSLFAIASLGLFIAYRPLPWRWFSLWVGAGVMGFAVTDGWWAVMLWREFGNPVFPYFNALFQSPDFPDYSMATSRRFMPAGWTDILTFPFRIALPESRLYVDLIAPDIRYAVAFASLPLAVLALKSRRLAAEARMTLATGATFLLGWVFWEGTSGAGRYLAPLGLAVAPMMVSWMWVATRSNRFVCYGLLLIVLAQAMSMEFATVVSRAGLTWQGPWLQAEIPAELRETPHLILSGNVQTFSALIAFIHQDSSLVSIGGQSPIQIDTRAGERLRQLIDRFEGHVKFMERVPPEPVHGDLQLYKYGLELDGQCQAMNFSQYYESMTSDDESNGAPLPVQLQLCSVRRRSGPSPAYFEERAVIGAAVDAVMKACPAVFFPDAGEIDGSQGVWQVSFTARDARIVIQHDTILLSNYHHPMYTPIGSLKRWSKVGGAFDCDKFPNAKSNDLSRWFTPEEIRSLNGM